MACSFHTPTGGFEIRCRAGPRTRITWGERQYREKIELLAPRGVSGTTSRTKRGAPALQSHLGKLAVGNALELEHSIDPAR